MLTENKVGCDCEGRVASDLWTQEQTLFLLLEILYVPYFHVIKPSAFDFVCVLMCVVQPVYIHRNLYLKVLIYSVQYLDE